MGDGNRPPAWLLFRTRECCRGRRGWPGGLVPSQGLSAVSHGLILSPPLSEACPKSCVDFNLFLSISVPLLALSLASWWQGKRAGRGVNSLGLISHLQPLSLVTKPSEAQSSHLGAGAPFAEPPSPGTMRTQPAAAATVHNSINAPPSKINPQHMASPR